MPLFDGKVSGKVNISDADATLMHLLPSSQRVPATSPYFWTALIHLASSQIPCFYMPTLIPFPPSEITTSKLFSIVPWVICSFSPQPLIKGLSAELTPALL